MPPVKKKKRQISPKVRVPGDTSKKKKWKRVEWVAVGGDVSMSSISLGGIAKTQDGKIRTGAVSVRWEKGTDYFKRLNDAAKAHDIVHDLFSVMKIEAELDEIHFAIEEAVPIGMLQRQTKNQKPGAAGAWMKQQIQISGAFLGGLVRWGYQDIREIQANQWRAPVAADLGITIHYTKWNPDKKIGKFRAKEWIEKFHPKWDGHWPDLINDNKLGLIARPEGRKAQAVQSDDRYEALAMASWMRLELKLGR